MVRTYKKKLGSRQYTNYPEETIDLVLEKVFQAGWSLRKAAREYKIPFGSLRNKFLGVRSRKNGGQSVFTMEEEKAFIEAASTCGEWGFPLSLLDIRQLAKTYLDSQGRNISKFKNNLPGRDWAYSLLKRHKNDITHNLAANIKRARADISRKVVSDYFENLAITLEGVPASNIFNYDETNLQDDPGQEKMLFRRGTKYPERVCNFTESATSIMMCGSASGVLLPPYVIYKSEKMWIQWTKQGPKGQPCCEERCCASGSRYNRTHHGWMDAQTFSDWFTTTFLPHAKRLNGRKILLGDNLSSHSSNEVLRLCEQNNIAFVCLPKNSTHLTQPLDVGFFRSFKETWRTILTKWKITHKLAAPIDKKDFPHLLAATLTEMNKEHDEGAIKKDLIASFRAARIAPLDPDRVLNKIPSANNGSENAVNTILVDYLQQQRFTVAPSRKNIKRQKLVVEAGRSVAAYNDESSSNSEINVQLTNDDSDDEPIEDVIQEVDLETEYFELKETQVERGKYVLVKIYGGARRKTVYRYVAMIERKSDDDEIEIMGIKSIDETKKSFKAEEDDEFVDVFSDIIAFLPDPE